MQSDESLRIIGLKNAIFLSFFSLGYISNNMEAIVAMLAAASIGAIWSSTSPDFGVTVCKLLYDFQTT